MVLYHSLWGSRCVFVRCSVVGGWFRLLAWSMYLVFCRNYSIRGVFRSHELRHTFATLSLENGIDVKTLSAMLGHVSAATTLDIYTHITDDMQTEAAAKIDRGLGNETQGARDISESEPPRMTDFQPTRRKIRRAGTGCITEINDHLFGGRYSPVWPDGKRHAKNVYATTRNGRICWIRFGASSHQKNSTRSRGKSGST